MSDELRARAKLYAAEIAHPILRDMLSMSRGQFACDLADAYRAGHASRDVELAAKDKSIVTLTNAVARLASALDEAEAFIKDERCYCGDFPGAPDGPCERCQLLAKIREVRP